MALTLTTLRCPDAAAPESRHASGGEFSIGRGPDNDWTLPDPERHLSKRHCVLAYRSGQWQIADLSANGTFLNRDTAPVGAGPRPLRDGDRIRFGAYEIEVAIREDVAPRPAQHRSLSPEMLDPFGDEPAPAPSWGREADPLLRDPDLGLAGHSVQLPADFDPLGAEDEAFQGPTHSDHTPAINDAFRPPPTPAAAIPDDWDLEAPLQPPAPAPRPVQAWVEPPPAVLPVAPPAPPPAPAPVPASQAPAPAESRLLQAFLRGAGADTVPPDPERTLEAAGAALRATVAGIRQALIARASIKGEFRIEQTMVRAQGNNPLKFSADDDDAMAAFLGIGRRNAMPGSQAVTEALRDMRLHELATMSAMQAAVRALMAQFDPDGIEKGVDGGGFAILPGQRKARAWDAFAAMHARVSQALSDDFDSVFGKAFARAYEQALRDTTHEEDRP